MHSLTDYDHYKEQAFLAFKQFYDFDKNFNKFIINFDGFIKNEWGGQKIETEKSMPGK